MFDLLQEVTYDGDESLELFDMREMSASLETLQAHRAALLAPLIHELECPHVGNNPIVLAEHDECRLRGYPLWEIGLRFQQRCGGGTPEFLVPARYAGHEGRLCCSTG